MGFFAGISKSFRLRKISKSLANPAINLESLMSFNQTESEQALEELFDLCESDQNVRIVMDKHNASRKTLKEVYHRLCASGAGQWVSGHYVAASAFSYPSILDYLLHKWGESICNDSKSFPTAPAYRVMRYFENGETGAISE